MGLNFPIELIAQHHDVLAVAGQVRLLRIAGVPDARFSHEIEPGLVHNRRSLALRIGTEEDGRPEDALECAYQPAVLGTALLHPEGLQHIASTEKGNGPLLLPDCQRGQEDRYEPVLPPRQAVRRVTGHLQQELAIAAFMQQDALRGSLHRQATQDEGARSKPQGLGSRIALQPNHRDGLCLAEPLFGNQQTSMVLTEDRAGRHHHRTSRPAAYEKIHGVTPRSHQWPSGGTFRPQGRTDCTEKKRLRLN